MAQVVARSLRSEPTSADQSVVVITELRLFMNIADTNTAPTTTFWLRRGATALPFLYLNNGGGTVTRARDAGITLLGS